MDPRLFLLWLVTAPLTSLSRAAPVSESFVVLVKPSVSVHTNHLTTLPCWLSPSQSAENLEVRWYRRNFDTPIMLYRAKTVEADPQEASYVGRVSFGSKDAGSGGLKDGDVSLELVNVTLADAGDYTCYVSSDQGYDSGTVQLIVTQSGASPLLSVTWDQDDLVSVSCESKGWYPEPQLRWSDQKQGLTPKGLTYTKEASGLVSVHSWIQVSGSSSVSCSVGLAGEEATEGRLHLENFIPNLGTEGPSVAGWVLFCLLLIAVIIGVLLFKYRDRISRQKSKSTNGDTEDSEKLLPHAFAEANECYVNIELENSNNTFLTIKDNLLRDNISAVPGGEHVTCTTAVRGTSGFSSGKHYWEVSLCKAGQEIHVKQSWWVGVTSRSPIPQDCDLPPTVANGFWFLSSSRDKPGIVQFSSNPAVSVQVQSSLKTVGVFLNYDSGELSFYDVEKKTIIGTFTAQFMHQVFPLFNPGKGDKSPMEVIHRLTEDEPTVNSAQHTK